MNVFSADYIIHNLPLIVLSGLGEDETTQLSQEKGRTLLREGGFRIRTDVPVLQGTTAKALLQTLLSHDCSSKKWQGKGSAQGEQHAAFRILTTGRTYTLPPRKAPPPPRSPRLRPASDSSSPPPQMVLHSTISPLTPSSPLYPDGIMTPLWITKHQARLPSVFISFFNLVSDNNTSTLQDNKLKTEINNIRSVLTSTNYKTKLVVVLLADGLISAADVEDRVNNIRKATTLDAKSLFYVAATFSQVEIVEFTKTLLSGLYAGCVEYYRELSKHARRKRNRNIVPQPTIQPSSGTSRTLSLAGWNVRYEFKLAVFAEFRQEMEAALRSYESAYEGLFGAEVFETIPSWSPRFNETRMLSDIITIRIIRCLLWLGATTNAVKSWLNHRNRIQSLIDRRGTGTDTYGWQAWQSTWSKTMADLVYRADVFPLMDQKISSTSSQPIYIDAEKLLPVGQRYMPWENLHHQGYWLNLAQRFTHSRREQALRMPEEDRMSPGQSPASTIASKAHLYDKYLALEPYKELPLDGEGGYDYFNDIINALDTAVEHFEERDQVRMKEILRLKKATELMRAQSWSDATSILLSIWQHHSWRQSGWWVLLEQIGHSLLMCATAMNNTELVAQVKWQIQHPIFLTFAARRQISNETIETPEQSDTSLDAEHSLTPVVPSFVFASAEGHVGEAMIAQLTLEHVTSGHAHVLQLLQVKIAFEGGLKSIYLVHKNDVSDDHNHHKNVVISELKLKDAQSTYTDNRRISLGAAAAVVAEADLAFNPGQVKVFQMQVQPREAGDVSVASIAMIFQNHDHEMTVATTETNDSSGRWWEHRQGKLLARAHGRQRDASAAKVLPKPPKVVIQIPEMRKVFYTNESIELTVDLTNQEDEAVHGTVSARMLSPGKNAATLRWVDGESAASDETSDVVTYVQKLPSFQIEDLAVADHSGHSVLINNTEEAIDHEFEIVFDYALSSSPETRLRKLHTIDISIIRPFEANFSFHSRFHAEAWPQFFSVPALDQGPTKATGIKQQYLITAVICSFANEDVIIESTSLATQKIIGEAVCSIDPGVLRMPSDAQASDGKIPVTLSPEETKRFGFDMTLQKLVLGDRQPVAIDVALDIRWRRKNSEEINTSSLQVPRFLAPTAEPRVLLQVSKDEGDVGLYRLSYTIENASLHFLTFNLTMESSEDFGFSGTKSKSLSLVPISRTDVVYRILPLKKKAWIGVRLEAVDAYFGQTLRIQPASDGVRVDKQGTVLVWVE